MTAVSQGPLRSLTPRTTGTILARHFTVPARHRPVRAADHAPHENPEGTVLARKIIKKSKSKAGAAKKATKPTKPTKPKPRSKAVKKRPKKTAKKAAAKVAKKTATKISKKTGAARAATKATKVTKAPTKKPALVKKIARKPIASRTTVVRKAPAKKVASLIKDLRPFRRALLRRQGSLLAAYNSTKGETRTDGSDGTEDYIDYAVSSYAREFSLSLTELERRQLKLVEDALHRIANREYGRCLNCREPIPPKRLEVEPWARHCIRCQELDDQGLLEPREFDDDDDEDESEAGYEEDGELAEADDGERTLVAD